MKNRNLACWTAILFLILLLNTAYVAAFSSATIFYMTNVLGHVVLGSVLTIAFLFILRRTGLIGAPVAVGALLCAFALGAILTYAGNIRANQWLLWAHIATGLLGVIALIPFVWKKASQSEWSPFKKGFQVALIVMVALPLIARGYKRYFPDPNNRIANPANAPLNMEGEGGGPKSPFFPASAQTNVGGIIPSNFFMDSETCGTCHKQIYDEWNASAHHFASFNNQFYRKAIEYMQDTQGSPQPSKWCAGCHDHAVFFNGRFEKPIKQQIDTPEAHAGLACTSCHAIVRVDSTMGNNGFTIEYPPLHQLMTSNNKLVRGLVDFMTYLNPEPHRETFLKPFMTQQASEFCSTCHKVHLDIPVNNYRWFRGFNDYDNWQASGFGEGARSFYYPPEGQTCSNCHMPLEPSSELGSRNGKSHSHRFPAANTALANANRDAEQLAIEQKFLTSGFISVDIFAASPVKDEAKQTAMARRASTSPKLSSGSAVGEESEQQGDTFIREVGDVAAPLDQANPKFKPGSTARVDVVVRTRKIGHFFPGGTLDSFDIWLELQAVDATGKVIFWSGQVADGGRGPVEPGAHFYKAYQLDGDGNQIDKRNAWQARSVLYVHAIQPGAADTVHYLLNIPKDARGPIHLTAKLNHRKFSWYYTQFAYAGKPKPGEESKIDLSHNGAAYSFSPANIPANVSGEAKGEIPVTPITVLAKAESSIGLTGDAAATKWQQVANSTTRERWNDWGIGLLLQGDLKGAEYAFTKVTEAEPGYADGWLNVARALIQEGETERAKPFIQKSLAANPNLGRTYYFRALIEKSDGDYDAALKDLGIVNAKYPRDRVVWNQVARIKFLKRNYHGSIEALKKVAEIDPEDLQMHYTAMLAYRGIGDVASAEREQKLFERFKADESSQAIAGKTRLASPKDNNERLVIHDHESVDLRPLSRETVQVQPNLASLGRSERSK
jgi:tetratricopeptide (TPR) repeat protein